MREFKGPAPLHARSIVVDRRTVLVDSYNVDPRSENLNTEVMCVADDDEVARPLIESIEVHVQNAWRVDCDGRPPHNGPVVKSWGSGLDCSLSYLEPEAALL
jgi:putative cardiolipin synthase